MGIMGLNEKVGGVSLKYYIGVTIVGQNFYHWEHRDFIWRTTEKNYIKGYDISLCVTFSV